MSIDKGALRVEIRSRLQALSDGERTQRSQHIVHSAQRFLQQKKVSSVCVYNSFGSEVQTGELVRWLKDNGIEVYMPRISGNTMETVRINDDTIFVRNFYGIDEPLGKDEYDADPDVIVMPLLAFDDRFNRLGRGKGYYDAYLKKHSGYRLALAYECQRADHIPCDEFDEILDAVITETGIAERNKG